MCGKSDLVICVPIQVNFGAGIGKYDRGDIFLGFKMLISVGKGGGGKPGNFPSISFIRFFPVSYVL